MFAPCQCLTRYAGFQPGQVNWNSISIFDTFKQLFFYFYWQLIPCEFSCTRMKTSDNFST